MVASLSVSNQMTSEPCGILHGQFLKIKAWFQVSFFLCIHFSVHDRRGLVPISSSY